jgi:F-type H+-transporting ATPase subunit delta
MSERDDAYATAIVGIAKAEGVLDRVEEELFRVARTLEANEQLRSTLTDQALPVELRQGIVEDLLGSRAHPVTTSLVSFLVGLGRGKDLPKIIDAFVAQSATARNEEVAEIRVAQPIDDAQRERLAAALGTATGKSLTVKVVVDPSIMGGVVARIGDTVIDGSVRHRLAQLRGSF